MKFCVEGVLVTSRRCGLPSPSDPLSWQSNSFSLNFSFLVCKMPIIRPVYFALVKWNSYFMARQGFPHSLGVKNPFSCHCRRPRRPGFDPWIRKIPWRRKWQPTPVFLPGELCGQWSLMGYSSWGHKESDMTEHI